jgi:hypothetical protein
MFAVTAMPTPESAHDAVTVRIFSQIAHSTARQHFGVVIKGKQNGFQHARSLKSLVSFPLRLDAAAAKKSLFFAPVQGRGVSNLFS